MTPELTRELTPELIHLFQVNQCRRYQVIVSHYTVYGSCIVCVYSVCCFSILRSTVSRSPPITWLQHVINDTELSPSRAFDQAEDRSTWRAYARRPPMLGANDDDVDDNDDDDIVSEMSTCSKFQPPSKRVCCRRERAAEDDCFLTLRTDR